MKGALLIISALLFLNCTTGIYQFLKLPVLLAHFRHHCKTDPELRLIDFLRIHYSPHHPADNDEEEDNQLPFKSVVITASVDLSTWTETGHCCTKFYVSGKTRFSYYSEKIPFNSGTAVFRPPCCIS